MHVRIEWKKMVIAGINEDILTERMLEGKWKGNKTRERKEMTHLEKLDDAIKKGLKSVLSPKIDQKVDCSAN